MDTSAEAAEARVLAEESRAEPRRRGASVGQIEAAYRAHGARFRGLASAVAGREAAGDVVQDAFALAVRKRASWRREGPLEAWLWRLVLSSATDAERRRARRDRLSAKLQRRFERASSPPASVDDALHGPLRRLPRRQRDCVVLRYYGDLSYGEIAEVMGIEAGTVGALLSKAHAALRAELQKEVR